MDPSKICLSGSMAWSSWVSFSNSGMDPQCERDRNRHKTTWQFWSHESSFWPIHVWITVIIHNESVSWLVLRKQTIFLCDRGRSWTVNLNGGCFIFYPLQKIEVNMLLFIADNLACFPYQTQDEPLFIMHHIDITLSVSGSNLLQSFKEVRCFV